MPPWRREVLRISLGCAWKFLFFVPVCFPAGQADAVQVRRLHVRHLTARAQARVPPRERRAARPGRPGVSSRQSAACRQQGRSHRRSLGPALRIGLYGQQPHRSSASGHRGRRQGTRPDQNVLTSRLSFRGPIRAEGEVGRADACQHSEQGLDLAATVPFSAALASSNPVIAVLPFVTCRRPVGWARWRTASSRTSPPHCQSSGGFPESRVCHLCRQRMGNRYQVSRTAPGRGLSGRGGVYGRIRIACVSPHASSPHRAPTRSGPTVSTQAGARLNLRQTRSRDGSSPQSLLERTITSSARRGSGRRDALQRYLLGVGEIYRWTRGSLDDGLQLFRQAIEIEPDFAAAHAMAAYCYVQRKSNGWIAEREKELAECGQLAYRAVERLRRPAGSMQGGACSRFGKQRHRQRDGPCRSSP